jgi:hypothetical protein
MPDEPMPGNLRTVFEYHDRSKHHLDRYARSLGFMDWNSQPNPFRRFEGAPLLRLELPEEEASLTYDSLYSAPPSPRPLDKPAIDRLFYYSLGRTAGSGSGGHCGSTRRAGTCIQPRAT